MLGLYLEARIQRGRPMQSTAFFLRRINSISDHISPFRRDRFSPGYCMTYVAARDVCQPCQIGLPKLFGGKLLLKGFGKGSPIGLRVLARR